MRYIKEIGIIFSYLTTLVCCYFFDWEPFSVFSSYVIEVVALAIIYTVLRAKDERNNPQKYRKAQSLVNVWMAILGFAFVQFFLIYLMSTSLLGPNEVQEPNVLMSKELVFAFFSVTFFYALQAIQSGANVKQIDIFLSNFLIKVIILSTVNLIGFLVVHIFEARSLTLVLSVMVAFRVLMEIFFERKDRIESSS